MSWMKDVVSTVLDNDGDFFTSGLRNAENSYKETKHLFTILSLVIGAICLGALFIRAIIF